jgi:GTPase SAR1 family protein
MCVSTCVHTQVIYTNLAMQWISEVLHFCQGLPILLIACKKDLRNDPHTIEELRKTSQRPVTYEEASLHSHDCGIVLT